MEAEEYLNDSLDISQISFSSWHYSTPAKKQPTTSPLSISRASLRSTSKRKQPSPFVKVNKTAHVRKTKAKANFKVPQVIYKCPECPQKIYKTMRYYKEHMLVHKVQGMSFLFDNINQQKLHCFSVCQQIVILCVMFVYNCFQMPVLAFQVWKNSC